MNTPNRIRIVRGRNGFIGLSTLAGMTFSLVASVWLLEVTHSSFLAALVFGGQWIGAAVYPSAAARLTRRISASRLAVVVEWSGGGLVVLAAGAMHLGLWVPVVAIVLVKGYTDSIGRTANTLVARERSRDGTEVGRQVSRMEFFRLVGSTSAGILFAGLGQAVPATAFALLCGAAQATAGWGLWLNCRRDPVRKEPEDEAKVEVRLRAVLAMTPLQRGALIQLCIVAAYQGIHNAIRTVYPIDHLHEGLAGVGIVSAIATAGVFAGGGVSSRPRILPWFVRHGAPLGTAVTAVLVVVATQLTGAIPSYAVYFLFLAAFEAAFMGCNARFVMLLDDRESALYLGVRSTVLGLSALVGLLVTSGVLAVASVPSAVGLTAIAFAVLSLSENWLTRRRARDFDGIDARVPR